MGSVFRAVTKIVKKVVKKVAPRPKLAAPPAPAPAPATAASPPPTPAVAPVAQPPPPPPPPPVFSDSEGGNFPSQEARNTSQSQINRRKKFPGTSNSQTTSVQTVRVKKASGRPSLKVSKLGSIGTGTGGSGVSIS